MNHLHHKLRIICHSNKKQYNYGNVTMSPEAMAALPDGHRELVETFPTWKYVVFAIAVVTGTLGSIALLLRKSWAVPVFLISLAAVIVQFGHSMLMTNAVEVMGTSFVVMSVVILIIAAFLYYYSKQCMAKGWLS